jgi:hypothetical protein
MWSCRWKGGFTGELSAWRWHRRGAKTVLPVSRRLRRRAETELPATRRCCWDGAAGSGTPPSGEKAMSPESWDGAFGEKVTSRRADTELPLWRRRHKRAETDFVGELSPSYRLQSDVAETKPQVLARLCPSDGSISAHTWFFRTELIWGASWAVIFSPSTSLYLRVPRHKPFAELTPLCSGGYVLVHAWTWYWGYVGIWLFCTSECFFLYEDFLFVSFACTYLF